MEIVTGGKQFAAAAHVAVILIELFSNGTSLLAALHSHGCCISQA
jgi:hypothetical protein